MATMNVRLIETPVHGRFIHVARDPRRLLVGFHGYGETAEAHLAQLERISGIQEWSIAAVQALHPFYVRSTQEVVASWMTKLDREEAIADNIEYVRRVVAALPPAETRVFAGFSQGAAMAWRAAAAISCDGVIAIGGDVPPDVGSSNIRALIARGNRDEWYTDEKLKKDLRLAPNAKGLVYDGGHEWTDELRAAAGEFLSSLTGQRVD
jgi:predicted esterase